MIRPTPALAASFLLAVALAPLAAFAAEPSGHWSRRFEPAVNMTAPLAVLDGEVVAGEYRLEDGEWRLLGNGIQPRPSYIDAVLVDGPNLYASGIHRIDSGFYGTFVAKWDGQKWMSLPIEAHTQRRIVLAMFDGQLHATAELVEDNELVSRVLRWDGSQWQPVGAVLPDPVYALAVFEGALYAGGGQEARSDTGPRTSRGLLARWDGDEWTDVGAALNGPVESLLVKDTSLYVGGCFSTVGSTSAVSAPHIARWDGSKWSAVGEGVGSDAPCGSGGRDGTTHDSVRTMQFYDGDLVVGGSFDRSGSVETKNIARWNGSEWLRFGDGFNRQLDSLAVADGDLFATGAAADVVDGAAIPGVARWNGTSWRPVVEAAATVGLVYALESDGDDLYAGGIFATAGGTEIRSIAKWNGVAWMELGSALSGYVLDIAVLQNEVYVAGSLRVDPREPFDYHVAKWTGASWQMIDDGAAEFVQVESFGGELYAAGRVGREGSILKKWDGQTWETVAEIERGSIDGLEAGDKLYVCGSLGRIGNVAYANVASWDGTQWQALGQVKGSVYTLAWSGTTLFASGSFTLGNSDDNYVLARWNGTKWRPIGPSDYAGYAFLAAARGESLFVNANGLLIDGTPYDGLARWDGSSWEALHGVYASAMAFVDDKLYVASWIPGGAGNNPETIAVYALGTCGNGVLDAGEECDHGIEGTGECCNLNTCRLAGKSTVCRASRGPCDQAESCTGNTDECPSDRIQPAGFVCREADDGCQSTGVCDGKGLTCSIDPIPPCSDGDFCNGLESCGIDGGCQSSAPVDCDDDNECTADYCAEGNESCGRGLAPGPGCTRCGDLDYDGWFSSIDALLVLRGAVGISACPPFPCDYDGSGAVTTGDALRVLRRAVGTRVDSACPGDTGEWPDDDYEEEQPDGG